MIKSAAKGLVLRPAHPFNGVQVFTASMAADRELMGERVTRWIASHPDFKLTEITVTQSSDASFHCFTITVFYYEHITFAVRIGDPERNDHVTRPSAGPGRRLVR